MVQSIWSIHGLIVWHLSTDIVPSRDLAAVIVSVIPICSTASINQMLKNFQKPLAVPLNTGVASGMLREFAFSVSEIRGMQEWKI